MTSDHPTRTKQMAKRPIARLAGVLAVAVALTCALSSRADDGGAGEKGSVSKSAPLTIVIVRHGEKADQGENLSCQGLNRALALPGVLNRKFGRPDWAYVPKLKQGGQTQHARMFQTLTPYAVQQNLRVNTDFGEGDVQVAAKDVLSRSGLVLMVWEHSQIPPLAKALGVAHPPSWSGDDFDSIWVITSSGDKVHLAIASEGIHPDSSCSF